MIDVIAHHGVKSFVRKRKFGRVTPLKGRIAHALRFGVVLAQRLVERGVFFAPAVDTDDICVRIAFGHSDGKRAAAAADVKPLAAVGDRNVFRNPVNDLLRACSESLQKRKNGI